MTFPENLRYTKDHEWVRLDGEFAFVGITDFAQKELGDIVYIDINTVGQSLAQEAVFGTVEAVKTVSDLFLPVAADIVEFNSTLNDTPEEVNNDAYGNGWMVKIKPANVSDVNALMDAAAYKALVGA